MARKKIGDLLVENGFITPEQLRDALKEQASTGVRLGNILTDNGLITEDQLVYTISERLDIQRISLSTLVIDPEVIKLVPVEVSRRYVLIPVFSFGGTLTLAMSDPLNIIAIEQVKYTTNLEIKRIVASASEIKDAIDQYYSVADSLNEIVASRVNEGDIGDSDSLRTDALEADSPIVRLVNVIVTKAVKDKASDIHIEPDESEVRVRYRISGIMREEAAPPKSMQNEVISRIKIAANMDVSEKRVPQDGRFMTKVDGAVIDLRVSTLPTIHGEKVVIRILDRRNLLLSFANLGFDPAIEESWKDLIRKPEGLVLICGPTSSGKTSTLYASLSEINSIEKNIVTIEDPVEYSLPLINQIQLNEKAGLGFPEALRSILRQNPDIIMVGEIRDAETARMAIRASLTGHLVFSTVHTNDAPSAITRLIDMGIEQYMVAASVKGILAQRLVRTNCSNCAQSYTPPQSVLKRSGLTNIAHEIDFKAGVGCRECNQTGLLGMTGIYEYFELTPELVEMVLEGVSLNKIRVEARKSGFVPLFESGLRKVMDGQVSLEELLTETSTTEEFFVDDKKPEIEQVNA